MKYSKSIIASALLAATGVAQAELSGTLGVASNYLFRGVTQTGDAAAVSGSVDYGHESGIYAGTWMSNVDFGGKEDMEVDFYAGYGGEAGSMSYDISYLYYWYPGAGGDAQGGDLDYGEIAASLGFGPVTASIAYTANAEADGPGPFQEGDLYYSLGFEPDMSLGGFAPSFLIGYYDFTDDGKAAVGDLSYMHWSVGLTKDAGDFGSFSVNYEQTDSNDTVSTDDNPNFWVGWSKDF
jgi:uncharacterized protein (TIGR02001 family)